MSTADETRGPGEDVSGATLPDPRMTDETPVPDLTAAGIGVTDEPIPGESDRSRPGTDPTRDPESPQVYSAGDVDLEDPDDEVQTTTEARIDEAASRAGRQVAAAARAGWDDPALREDPPADYDLTAPPEGGDADPPVGGPDRTPR